MSNYLNFLTLIDGSYHEYIFLKNIAKFIVFSNTKILHFQIIEFLWVSSLIIVCLNYIIDTKSFLNAMLYAELFYFLLIVLYISSSSNYNKFDTVTLAFIFLVIAASESAIGLTLLVCIKKSYASSIYTDENNKLRG